jgi:hypothetical protein
MGIEPGALLSELRRTLLTYAAPYPLKLFRVQKGLQKITRKVGVLAKKCFKKTVNSKNPY